MWRNACPDQQMHGSCGSVRAARLESSPNVKGRRRLFLEHFEVGRSGTLAGSLEALTPNVANPHPAAGACDVLRDIYPQPVRLRSRPSLSSTFGAIITPKRTHSPNGRTEGDVVCDDLRRKRAERRAELDRTVARRESATPSTAPCHCRGQYSRVPARRWPRRAGRARGRPLRARWAGRSRFGSWKRPAWAYISENSLPAHVTRTRSWKQGKKLPGRGRPQPSQRARAKPGGRMQLLGQPVEEIDGS